MSNRIKGKKTRELNQFGLFQIRLGLVSLFYSLKVPVKAVFKEGTHEDTVGS